MHVCILRRYNSLHLLILSKGRRKRRLNMVSKSLRHICSTTDIASLSESDKCYLKKMQNAVTVLLKGIGEDPSREGLRDTPRVRNAD